MNLNTWCPFYSAGGKPISLNQLPQDCGYSVYRTELGLLFLIQYDGCDVINQVGFVIDRLESDKYKWRRSKCAHGTQKAFPFISYGIFVFLFCFHVGYLLDLLLTTGLPQILKPGYVYC